MISMKKIGFLAVLLCMLGMLELGAVPARPQPVEIVQADGTRISVRIYGDEHFHYVTDMNGYVLGSRDGLWYLSSYSPDGRLSVGNVRAGRGIPLGASKFVPQGVASLVRQKNSRPAGLGDGGYPTTGRVKSLVLLVNFTDMKFTVANPQGEFYRLLNESGYADGGATGSAKDYYMDNSAGKFEPQFDVFGPVELDRPMSYYGGNDSYGNDMNPREMVLEVCQKAASQLGVNLKDYDVDGDGILDNVFIYYAGHNEAEGGAAETIWPHRAFLKPGNYVDGVQVYGYACSSEYRGADGRNKASIGTFCHEFGHVLGFPDLYDTDGANEGWGDGVYNWSLMCSGSYNNDGHTPPYLNAMERWIAGWAEPEYLTGAGEYSLGPVQNDAAYIVKTGTPDEFFLLENRQKYGWDAYLGGHGLLVYHVDRSGSPAGAYTAAMRWETNTVNSNLSHECMRLVKAYPAATSAQTDAMPFPGTSGNTRFTSASSPAAKAWNGEAVSQGITDIRESGNNIHFKVAADGKASVGGTVTARTGRAISGAKVVITAASQDMGSGMIRMAPAAASAVAETVTGSDGSYSFAGLTPGRYELEVSAAGCLNSYRSVVAVPGNNVCDIVLVTEEEQDYEYITWSKDKYNTSIGMNDSYFEYGVAWDAGELDNYAGYGLQQVRFFIKDDCDAELLVYINDTDTPAMRKDIDVIPGTFAIADISDARLSVPPGQKIIVSLRLSNMRQGTYPAGADMGPAVAGKGDLVRMNGRWQSIHELNPDINFNWLIGVYLRPQEAVPVTSVTIDRTSASIAAGDTLTLKAGVLPADATDKSLVWTTSDASVATVDSKGFVTAHAPGQADITASTPDGAHSATCRLDCVLEQKLTGLVTGKDGRPVGGVDVTAAPVQPSGTRGMVMKASASGEMSATTGADGRYEIMPLPEGEWLVTFSKEGYRSVSRQIAADKGLNRLDITISTEEESKSTQLSWHNGIWDQMFGAAGREVVLAAKFDADDLRPYVGYKLSRVDFLLGAKVPKATVNVYIVSSYMDELVPAYSKEVTPLNGEFTSVDLKDLDITIPDGKYILVGYQISGYDPDSYPVALDSSEPVEGKGNLLMSMIDYRWTSISEELGVPGNLLITAYVMPGDDIVPVEEISIEPAAASVPERETVQLSAKVTPADATNKNVSWKSSDESVATVDDKGLVKGVKAGQATISASSISGEITASASVTVTAARQATLSGRLVSSDGSPVAGATVSVSEIVPSRSASRFAAMAVSDQHTAVSADDGRFSISGLLIGKYSLTATCEGYLRSSLTVDIDKTAFDAGDITMEKDVAYGAIELKRHNGEYNNAIGGQGYTFSIASFWTEEELTGYQGYTIDYIRLYLQADAAVEVQVWFGDPRKGVKPVVSKEATPEPGGFVNIDIREFALTVPAHTDIAVGYAVKDYAQTDYPAAVDTSEETRGEGSLMNIGGEWQYLSDVVQGYSGNWMVGALLNKADKVPVDNIDLSVRSKKLYVGDTVRVNAIITPDNATNKWILWSSSDSKAVSVDDKGLLTALSGGRSVITASSEDGNASATIEIEAVDGQLLRGTVTDHFGQPVEGAEISITSASSATAASEGIWMMSAPSGDRHEALTDKDGFYMIEGAAEGKYILTVSKEGFTAVNEETVLSKGVTVSDIVLEQELFSESVELKWHNGKYDSAVGASGNDMTAAAGWTADELADYEGYKLLEGRFFIYSECKAEAVVFFGDSQEPAFSKEFTPVPGKETVVSFYDDNIFIPQGEQVRIGYTVSGYDKNSYPAALDSSPTREGKGNLVLTSAGWTTIAAATSGKSDGNWLITAVIAPESLMNIEVAAGQTSAFVKWDAGSASEWTVQWRKQTDKEFGKPVTVKAAQYTIEGLEEDTEYTVRVTGNDGSASKTFRTVSIQGTNPGILLTYSQPAGTSIPLQLVNKPKLADKVVWYIDGKPADSDTAVFSAGEHEVMAEIWCGGIIEYVIAYIEAQ